MLLVLILLAIVFFTIYFKIKFSYWKKRGLKGPTPWPFFGSIIEENLNEGRAIEERFLKNYGPVFGTYAGTKPVFNTSVPEHIKQVLTDVDTFHSVGSFELNDPYLKYSIFFRNDARWKSHRSAMSHHFTSGKLKSMIDHFKNVTDNFIKNVDKENKETGNKPINVKPLMKCYGIDVISKFVFALDVDSFQEKDSEWVKQAMQIGSVNVIQSFLQLVLPQTVSRLLKLNAIRVEPSIELGKLFKKMFEQRKQNGLKYNDLIELLDDAIEKGTDMTEAEKIGNCLLAYFAGVETVSNALAKTLQFLIEEPEVQDRLYNECKKSFSNGIDYETLVQQPYLDAVVNESLRLGTAIFIQERTAMKDTHIGEFPIEKGTEIYIIPYISHTNPDNWPNPKKFDPERFMDKSSSNENKIDAGTFLPFSQGRKACLGKLLALLEVKYLLVRLLLTYDLIKPKDFKIEADSVRGFESIINLPIIFQKR